MANYTSQLTGAELDQALQEVLAHEAEGFAVGEINGTPVGSGSPYYNNNAKYYAALAQSAVPDDTTGAVFWETDQSGTLNDTQKAQARKNIMAGGTNPNLLTNPWFLVNQRNATSGDFSNGTYRMDRWSTTYGTSSTAGSWTWSNGTITVTNGNSASYFQQKIDSVAKIGGKVVTGSIMMSDGTIYSGTLTRTNGTQQSFSIGATGIGLRFDSNNQFQISISANTTKAFKAAKLEIGSTSTLANDVPPDYGEELAKCLYYYERITAVGANLSISVGNVGSTTTQFYAPIKIAPKRTTSPTLAKSGDIKLGTSSLSITASAIAWQSFDNKTGQGTLLLTIPSGQTAGAFLRFGLNTNAYIEFKSDY